MRYLIPATLVLLSLSPTLQARPCNGNHLVRETARSGEAYTIEPLFDIGATELRIEESLAPNFRQSKSYTVDLSRPQYPGFLHTTSAPLTVYYRVTQFGADPSFVPCTYTDSIEIAADPQLERMARRSTIPVAGSLTGANGTRFRTELTLHNPGSTYAVGRLIFHAADRQGSDGDPSMPFSLAPSASVTYDDAVAAIGGSGLGSIDVVSETMWLPLTNARILSEGPGDERHAVLVPQIRFRDFYEHVIATVFVPRDRERERLAIGMRSWAYGGSAAISVIRNGEVVANTTRQLGPDTMIQLAADDFAQFALEPGDVVRINTLGAVAWSAATDNRTGAVSLRINDLEEQDLFLEPIHGEASFQ